MAFYEIVFIVRPDMSASQVEQISSKFADVVRENSGRVIKTEQWGLRTLSFRVKKHKKGYYVMLGTEGNGTMLAEVERLMRISEDIIRFLSVRVEELTATPSIQMAPPRRRFDAQDASDEASDDGDAVAANA